MTLADLINQAGVELADAHDYAEAAGFGRFRVRSVTVVAEVRSSQESGASLQVVPFGFRTGKREDAVARIEVQLDVLDKPTTSRDSLQNARVVDGSTHIP